MNGIIRYWSCYKKERYDGDKMIVVINDLSFKRNFSDKSEAIKKVHQWMDICKKIESQETTTVEEIYSVMLNTSAEIAPDYPLIELVKEFETRDERRYLIHLLTNLSQPENMPKDPFCLKGECSYICSWAKEECIISLESDFLFGESTLDGEVRQEKVSIKNLSKQEHIRLYEEFLGIRHYEANKKHRKQPYMDAAGRYVAAMDLSVLEAQELLNHAIEIEGNLYGKRNGQYYSFQRHHANYYHGYQNNNLGLHIRNKIDTECWE